MVGHSRDVTDEIRSRVGILDVVSVHVTLRRAGRNYKGLCPFHSEKTPSFTVNPERGFFYCFGCHAGGDVFDFVMRIGGVPFAEARRELAERAGVRLDEGPDPERRAGDRERLLRAVAGAAAFFRAQLAGEAGRRSRDYLAARGITPDMVERFGIGYAPPGWDHLFRALRARGFEPAVLEQAGLATGRQGGDGYYDTFRDRVVFPIRDLQGRPVAFGGRALDDTTPKYLNSRETPLFVKGKTLYALDLARASIRESGDAVVVEGYVDALTCHQFGIDGAVASLGTALTLDQVLLLKRFASRVTLVYDADAAGADAATRGIGVFNEAGREIGTARDAFTMPMSLFGQAELPVRVAVLPPGVDPDSFLRTEGPERFRALLAAALPIFEYRLEIAMKRHDARTVEGKVGIVDEMSQLISMMAHPVRQAECVRVLAERLGVREDAIREELRRLGTRDHGRRPARPAATVQVPQDNGRAAAEQLLVHLLVAEPGFRAPMRRAITAEMFRDPGCRVLAAALLGPEAAEEDAGALRERLRDETAISLLSRFLIAEPPVRGDMHKVAGGCVQKIRLCDLEERIAQLMAAHGEAVRAGDDARRDGLAAELLKARTEKERLRELKVSV